MIKARGTTSEVFNGESLEGIEDIIKFVLARKKRKKMKRNGGKGGESSEDDDDQLPETMIQK